MKKKLIHGEFFKRVLSMVLTFVMLLSLAPVVPHVHAAEGDTTVYLKPNANWLVDNARFAIYYWDNSGNYWTSMSDTDGDGYYEGTVPAGYSNVIFCRMNPGTTENNWNNKWNQTSDLTILTDGKNCYTVAEGAWDNGSGEWSAYSVSVTYSVSYQLTNVTSSNSAAYVEGNTPYTTTLTAEKGYTLPASVSVSAGGSSVTVTYDSATGALTIPAEVVTGDIVITASGVALTYLKPNSNWTIDNARFAAYCWIKDGDSTWVDLTASEETGYYEAVIPAGYPNVIFCRMNPSTTENNWDNKWNQTGDLTIPTDGKNCYTVPDSAWDNSDNTNWSVYPPEESGEDEDDGGEETTTAEYYLIGYINGADYGCEADYANLGEYKFVDGKLTATFTQDSYVFVKTGDNANWYMAEAYSEATSVTLKNTSTGTSEKLKVPGNVELTFTLAENTDGSLTLSYANASAEEATDYYLFGYINGANYACEDDFANMGDYKFENGQLTVTFTSDSYVAVKTTDNAAWYMTDGWLDEVTSATLYNTTTLTDTANKLFVPGGVEVTLTLVDNGNDTLTLSYEETVPEGYTAVRVHFLKPDGWGSTINAYLWTSAGAVTGYSDYNTWPGKAIGSNTTHAGWYDLLVATENPTAFNFIFNDGGNQTNNLSTGEVTGDTELWVVGNEVLTTAPGEWTGDYDYTANIHFQKPADWGDTINAWIWADDATIPGYEQYHTTWPGSPIDKDSVNSGWYNVSVTMDENAGFSFILNDGTNQTNDLATGTLQVKTDIWVVNGEVLTEAPEGWVNPDRKVYVPGTFPGPSWDAASNQMTYDPELGLYVCTFEDVPAANYEFKIAINGSWSENYGMGGNKDGANIGITVPETMDVTVYYNDNTHYAVTNVNYVFADITLSGADIPEGTKLTDKGLTGIYTVTVDMVAGEYTDVKLTYDGKDYTFDLVDVKEDKAVTFYMDPVTGIYYNNASGEPIDTDAIYFNSKDTAYKSVFGAVATGEEVTFTIDTGSEISSAVLVIKGVASYPMSLAGDDDDGTGEEADGETGEETGEETDGETGEETEEKTRWSCTASLKNIGEYDYYFVLSNGSAVVVYGDDDGYYGEGKISELTDVLPYDLVVYKSGFETPDWMKNAVVYQIFPDRFFDGDSSNNLAQTWSRGDLDYEYISDWYTLPENPEQEALQTESVYKSTGAWYGDGEYSNEIYGGDLKGITQKIDYLKALGVNVIYLNPVFWSISNHRYDAVDYTEIDPILGTLGDFEELVSVAKANGMHIILDGVFNHVSDDSIYFDRYYKFLGTSEKIGAYPYWAYVYDYMAENSVDKAAAEAAAKEYFSKEYGITDYSYTAWFEVRNTTMAGTVDETGLRAGKEVYSYQGWWGYDSMPVIYSTNGSEYQTGNWAQEIISGSGSVTQYWISKGSNGWRLDVANEVSDETWQRFRESVKSLNNGDAVIVGEIWTDATKYLMGDMYDSVMNYMFRTAVTNFAMGTDAETTTKEMEKLRERYPEEAFYAMMNLVGSHDTSRILSYLDGIGDDRADKSLSAAFPTYANTSSLAKNRQYLVSFLQFTYPGAPTIYYGDEIGMVGADDPDDRRAFAWGKGNKEIVEWYAKMAAIREAYPALRTGSIEPLDLENGNLLAYIRSDDANKLIVIGNNSTSTKTVTLPEELDGSYVDLVSGAAFDGTVPGLRGVILVPADEAKTVSVNSGALAPAYDPSYTVGNRSATHEHNWTLVSEEGYCDKEGVKTYICQGCLETKTETVKVLDHDWDDGFVTKEATCTKKGVITYTCGRCGETETEDVPKLGHDWDNGVVTKKATCTRKGEKTYTCGRCGDTKTEKIAALGHNFVNGKCTICGADQTSAQTGDTLIYAWISVMSVSAVALMVILIARKRRKA